MQMEADAGNNPVDILGNDLDILFVGFNPSPRSAELGHPYAGRGNHFYRLLAAAGLTGELLAPTDSRRLLEWRLGSTNLVARATATAAELGRGELRAGVPHVAQAVAQCRPSVIAYTGKGVYLAAASRARADWGLQPDGLFADARDFVLPSPSGLVRLSFADKLHWYQELALLRGVLRGPRGEAPDIGFRPARE